MSYLRKRRCRGEAANDNCSEIETSKLLLINKYILVIKIIIIITIIVMVIERTTTPLRARIIRAEMKVVTIIVRITRIEEDYCFEE